MHSGSNRFLFEAVTLSLKMLHIQVSAGDESRKAGAEMSCMAGAEMSCMAGAEMSCMAGAEVSRMAGDDC